MHKGLTVNSILKECVKKKTHNWWQLTYYSWMNRNSYSVQVNHQPDATVSPVYYPDIYLQLNTFWASSCPLSGAQHLQLQPLVLPSYRGDSRAVVRSRPEHEQQHSCHHDTKVKPETATAVVELLMTGVKMPETCWAVNKCQDNKLEKLLHLVGDLFELYDDARTCKL
jgi:hypothetical protein